jgi:hypothetical protein
MHVVMHLKLIKTERTYWMRSYSTANENVFYDVLGLSRELYIMTAIPPLRWTWCVPIVAIAKGGIRSPQGLHESICCARAITAFLFATG